MAPMNGDGPTKITVTLPVSSEVLAGSFDVWAMLTRRDERTPEQRAKDAADRAREVAANRAQIDAEHSAAVSGTSGVVRAVLELHGPAYYSDNDDRARCEGCDSEGYETESPTWPCRTYQLITASLP